MMMTRRRRHGIRRRMRRPTMRGQWQTVVMLWWRSRGWRSHWMSHAARRRSSRVGTPTAIACHGMSWIGTSHVATAIAAGWWSRQWAWWGWRMLDLGPDHIHRFGGVGFGIALNFNVESAEGHELIHLHLSTNTLHLRRRLLRPSLDLWLIGTNVSFFGNPTPSAFVRPSSFFILRLLLLLL